VVVGDSGVAMAWGCCILGMMVGGVGYGRWEMGDGRQAMGDGGGSRSCIQNSLSNFFVVRKKIIPMGSGAQCP